MKFFRDTPLINGSDVWCSKNNNKDEYFQINSPEISNFTSVLIQGYKACKKSTSCLNCFYIKNFSLQYSLDGAKWENYKNGTTFTGNSDS
jgi:hypothetical protein